MTNGRWQLVKGTFAYGKRIRLVNGRSIQVSAIQSSIHCGGWQLIS